MFYKYIVLIEPKRKIALEGLQTQDISASFKRLKMANKVNLSTNDYYKTKTPVNESKGELLDEFITPDVNSEIETSQQNGMYYNSGFSSRVYELE